MSELRNVGVIGSGIMGSGLAEVAARAGCDVVVRSRTRGSADSMVATIDRGLAKAVERGKATEDERAAIIGRISATDDLDALAECDLVIESIVEDLAVKNEMWKTLDAV